MADAVHEGNTDFVGVDDIYKNYADVSRTPLAVADGDDEVLDRVKALETYRAAGVPWLGYSYQFTDHPSEAKTIIDERVEADQKVRTAAALTAQDVIDDH